VTDGTLRFSTVQVWTFYIGQQLLNRFTTFQRLHLLFPLYRLKRRLGPKRYNVSPVCADNPRKRRQLSRSVRFKVFPQPFVFPQS
jgi:hypothetical protein